MSVPTTASAGTIHLYSAGSPKAALADDAKANEAASGNKVDDDPDVKLRTWTPKADPSGGYAFGRFRRAESMGTRRSCRGSFYFGGGTSE
jgi:hypothetical protein